MIDPSRPLFIVQPNPDGTLTVQKIAVDHLRVRFHGELRRGSGLYSATPTFDLTGRFDGGGIFHPGDAEAFVTRPQELDP